MAETARAQDGVKMVIVGLGGIGSTLVDLLVPALSTSEVATSLDGIEIELMDSDEVESSNIPHQRFDSADEGRPKASVLADRHRTDATSSVRVCAAPLDLVDSSQLTDADLVVIAVDRPDPRRIVHALSDVAWLDIRCRGDAMLALDHRSDIADVDRLTPDHKAVSCQLDGAIAIGNIEFGFSIAASHAAQWCLQTLRQMSGANTKPPPARAFSITHGLLQTFIHVAPASAQPALVPKPSRASRRWTDAEEELLLAEAESGLQLEQIVAAHERSAGAIFRRLCRLVFPTPRGGGTR